MDVLGEIEAATLPEFQRPDGRLDQGKYQSYIARKDDEVAAVRPPRAGVTGYELSLVLLIAKVSNIAEEIEASQRMMWPPDTDGSRPGTPWGQPYWLTLFLGAYWEGKAEGRDDG